MTEPLDLMAVAPNLQRVLTLRVAIGPGVMLGDSVDGVRCNYPIVGGTFEGVGVSGQVLAGGEDLFLLRPDGVGQLDARYSLRTDQGELINLRNRGLLNMTEYGRQLEREGQWPIPEAEYRCTCTPVFQVPKGRLDWLSRASFIGLVQYPSADQVVIWCYRFY
ncbi:DUF3237 domain-containing protein [Pseudomonas sp. FP597]|uniref:DUF3237 domain-containing protein n=1 Tax=Pseudomonas sp. FP597 TaxID=2954096 RepID=UPI0027356FFE|nr:DUF3237 domain-containing protein [Pseudomonas sp. FP597]WLI09035.1 DUF3237 domain-containing protein [Pseudomonas sp. FP597]